MNRPIVFSAILLVLSISAAGCGDHTEPNAAAETDVAATSPPPTVEEAPETQYASSVTGSISLVEDAGYTAEATFVYDLAPFTADASNSPPGTTEVTAQSNFALTLKNTTKGRNAPLFGMHFKAYAVYPKNADICKGALHGADGQSFTFNSGADILNNRYCLVPLGSRLTFDNTDSLAADEEKTFGNSDGSVLLGNVPDRKIEATLEQAGKPDTIFLATNGGAEMTTWTPVKKCQFRAESADESSLEAYLAVFPDDRNMCATMENTLR